ncbi:hypothetical protein MARA_39900 [Mycolicibacterium arabiense]|uniref:Uncharacterized protein n=1 Tax=Mycolicibacterium arabiense TaxID=1286181 RepID=A0A7I7S0W4_9MYCO|nr:hypothetical protein MARA_39900 [Mycolicibacterium arabiense]
MTLQFGAIALHPQNVGWGDGFDERAGSRGEFRVRGGQRVGLQLGQRDVLGPVGVRPVEFSGDPPGAVLQYSVPEESDPQPADAVENLATGAFVDVATAYRAVDEGERLRAQQRRSREAVLRWDGRVARGEVDGRRCVDDEDGHP